MVANENDRPAVAALPIGLAALTGGVCFVLVYGALRPVMGLLPVWWAQLLIY